MTNSVSIVGLNQGSAAQAPAASSAAATAGAPGSGVDFKPLVKDNSTPISPRIVVDPLAGVITQFLSSTGQLESQIPSAAVVAYLRAGLTTDGLTKPSTIAQDEGPKQQQNSVVA